MTPFLTQVARHYLKTAEDISRLVFVLPSRRSELFFQKYLCELVNEESLLHTAKPVIAPQTLPIDAFLSSFCKETLADRLSLLLELYACYSKICRQKGLEYESLDEFVFWGDVILNDFNDIDKYRINAPDLLRNVSDFKELGDDLSHLSEVQINAVRQFLGRFIKPGEYKHRFARLWNILAELYIDFNGRLDQLGISYEGRMYRKALESMEKEGSEAFFHSVYRHADKVVFCGLNVLCECEMQILDKLQKAGLAQFCWDYADDRISNELNKSSLFMRENIRRFPQAFELESCSGVSQSFTVMSIPSAVGQVKALADILEQQELSCDENTAIVLPDESLLQPLLDSIPLRVKNINVTMGCAMSGSSFYTMMNDLAILQLRLRYKDGKCSLYHKPFWNIVSNNLFDALLDENEKALLSALASRKQFFIPVEDILSAASREEGQPGLLSLVARPALKNADANDAAQLEAIMQYQLDILDFIGNSIASDDELKTRFSLELDFAMEYVKAVNLLKSRLLPSAPALNPSFATANASESAATHETATAILPRTYFALLDNILRSRSVPLAGEPLQGLQIMGPLETRALDFENVIIFGCNEGVFPRSEANSSFIPPLLRKAFGLPSREYHDAVWAYYFYRLIQRPSGVWMCLDSRSEGMRTGEESRYIKQLAYHFRVPIRRIVVNSAPEAVKDSDTVQKTAQHIEIIKSKPLSASSLKTYLSCSMKFYLAFVEGLEAEDELLESMDSGVIGNVYHNTMETLYKSCGSRVSSAWLESAIKDKKGIASLVDEQTCKEMHTESVTGRDIIICAIITRYVLATLKRDLEMLKESGRDSFAVIALEKNFRTRFHGLDFKGRVDRLDSFSPGELRLVDYKTGRVLPADTNIDDSNAESIAEKIFSPSTKSKDRPEIALQFFIYDLLLDSDPAIAAKFNKIFHSVYSTRDIMSEAPVVTLRNELFIKHMKEKLQNCIDEILNPDLPFVRVAPGQNSPCSFCDFKIICGR